VGAAAQLSQDISESRVLGMSGGRFELGLQAAKDVLVVAQSPLHVVALELGALLRSPEVGSEKGAGVIEAKEDQSRLARIISKWITTYTRGKNA